MIEHSSVPEVALVVGFGSRWCWRGRSEHC